MDVRARLTPETVKELCKATDLALRATKHTIRGVGRWMAGSVGAEHHLWVNLTDIRDKKKVFLLDSHISQTGLFGEVVSSVVEKFSSQAVHAQEDEGPLKHYLPLLVQRA